MERDEIFRYWLESSGDDYQVMQSLFDNGHYAWALFHRDKGIQTMVPGKDKQLIYQKIRDYVQTLERSNVPFWRLYAGYAARRHRFAGEI